MGNSDFNKAAVFKLALMLILFLTIPAVSLAQSTENAKSGENSQTAESNQTALVQTSTEKTVAPVLMPVLKNYKEVIIGMPLDEVRDKLGKAELGDQKSLFYRFSDEESAQLLFDGDKKVRVISMMYVDKNGNAPQLTDIFGANIEVAPGEDGSIYKMVRYPDAGYVVVYSRSTGATPMVIVTMQKI